MLKRLVFLAVLVAAVWYGSKHYKDLIPRTSGDVEVVNHSGRAIHALRISVGEQTVAVEDLEDGATRLVSFQPNSDGTFRLVWASSGVLGERIWSGGSASTAIQTHHFDFRENGDVTWTHEAKAN